MSSPQQRGVMSFQFDFPSVPFLPSVTAKATTKALPAHLRGRHKPPLRTSRIAHNDEPPAAHHDHPAQPSAERAEENDLDYLTEDDRQLIQAVTGEVITPGQRPQDSPLSAFAMQLAVDRKRGGLSAGIEVSAAYLQRTSSLLLQLNVPANPFVGESLDRALDFVHRKTKGHLGRERAAQDALGGTSSGDSA